MLEPTWLTRHLCGGTVKKIITAGATAFALVVGVLASVAPAQAALNVPKTSWPVCSTARTTYCVESVSITTSGGVLVPLTWVADGQVLATPESATVSTDTATVTADTTTVVAPTIPTVATGRSLSGRWTSLDWSTNGLDSLGFGGLYVDAKTANEFVNHVFIDVLPTFTGSDKKVKVATQVDKPTYAVSMDPDTYISVTVKTGEIKPGVLVGVGTNFAGDYSSANGLSTIKFSGSPVTVALAAKSADCSGETGVAKANVRQFQAMLFINNEGQSAFGVEGTSGDMVVSSNGVCDLSTPVWNAENKEFAWTAAAPHFAADGVTPNIGFYKAVIPAADAKLLWGLDNVNDAVKALSVQVITDGSVTTAAVATVGVKSGKIIIDVSGFGYSRPKLKIALKKSWKPATTMLNKTTITCVMGKSVKKITAVKPTCPKGYKKK
ncbi:MAG: hypothetical protein RIQ39_703 [Actinomycetota bacterium]